MKALEKCWRVERNMRFSQCYCSDAVWFLVIPSSGTMSMIEIVSA